MKKMLALLSLTTLVFAGCNFSTPKPIPEVTDKLTYKTHEVEEETDYYIVNVTYPEFSNSAEASELIEEMMLTAIDEFKDEIDEMELTPEELGEFFVGKNGFYVDYEVFTQSNDLISVAFYDSVYWSGAAHPMPYTETFNYDINEARELGLLDFFVPDTDYAGALSMTIIPKLKKWLLEDEFADDDWIETGAGPEPENFQQFTITEEGFVFHFDAYVVAPYAAGPQRIEVSFNTLYAILLPPWNGEPIN